MELMSTGWAERGRRLRRATPRRRTSRRGAAALSERFSGQTLVVPTGPPKVRSNDTDFRFRPGTDFFWLTGEMEPDAVLVMEPEGDGHRATLYLEPPSDRSTHAFFTDSRYGEFWIGPRMGLDEISEHLGVAAAPLAELHERLEQLATSGAAVVRGIDPRIDEALAESDGDDELDTALSDMRLVKDDFEVAMLQQAVDSTIRGFEDVVKAMPDAMESGERVVEGVFNARARLEGNDTGYSTIAASGAHATVLHWSHNDGEVNYGDLLLLDAGVECRQLYTADVTRTIPVSGKFTAAQRELPAGVRRPARGHGRGEARAEFMAPHRAAMRVLSDGLRRLGILTVEPRGGGPSRQAASPPLDHARHQPHARS